MNTSSMLKQQAASEERRPYVTVALSVVLWWAAYSSFEPLAGWLTYDVLTLLRGSQLGESVAFFLYDVPKILLLLSGMIFLVSLVRTFFSPERAHCSADGARASATCSPRCSAR